MTTKKSVISRGFKEDCKELIARFERANDIRFQTFAEVWKQMQFSLVFTGRQSFIELIEFCEESLNICKQFLLSPPRFKERIGGLYLLYGVYYKMPIKDFKMRVTKDEWKTVKDFHAHIKEAEHLDADYILSKLIADNAFYYCIFDLEYGLEKHFNVRKTGKCFNPYSVLPLIKDITDKHPLLLKVEELSKTYEEKKQQLLLKDPSDISLQLYNSNFVKEFISDVQEFEEERRRQQIKNMSNSEQPSTSGRYEKKIRGPYKRKIRVHIEDSAAPEHQNELEDDSMDVVEADFDSDVSDSIY